MIKLLKTKTQLMGAAMTTGMFMYANGVSAQDFNAYTENLSSEVSNVPSVIGFVSYLGGFALAALGVVGLKNHVENPQGTALKVPLAKLGFGGMLLALPPVVNALQGSGDVAGNGATAFNDFGVGSISSTPQ